MLRHKFQRCNLKEVNRLWTQLQRKHEIAIRAKRKISKDSRRFLQFVSKEFNEKNQSVNTINYTNVLFHFFSLNKLFIDKQQKPLIENVHFGVPCSTKAVLR